MAPPSSDAGTLAVAGSSARKRVGQFVAALRFRDNPAVDQRLQEIVADDDLWLLLDRLSPFDRAHHLAVYDQLVRAGYADRDLLLAASLHDVGKADDRGRVRLWHRILHVILGRFTPQGLSRLARSHDGPVRHGLHLAHHHAALGADLAARAGASARCADLIERHHVDPATIDDPELIALITADCAASV